jgi:hypothetical protein
MFLTVLPLSVGGINFPQRPWFGRQRLRRISAKE